jgi:uncharacterized protein (TIGR02678 family)
MSVYAHADAVSPEIEADRRRALRILLRRPLLLASGETAHEYQFVRRHADWLKQWLHQFPVWSLRIDKEAARLCKIPPDLRDDTRPAIDAASGAPFSKRRYVLVCLALATLERMDRQTTLGYLAKAIMELVAADRDLQAAGLTVDIQNYDHRRDLVHAVRFLMENGILRKLDGDEGQFLNRNGLSDVLYDIHRPVLAALLNVSRSPTTVDAPGAAGDAIPSRLTRLMDDLPTAQEEPALRIRSRLIRALLDDPVLYFDDLTNEERTYFEEHRGYLLRQVSEATGLIAESRLEGVAMVDDAGDATDLRLPDTGTDGHLTLLLAQWLAQSCKSPAHAAIPISAIEEHVRSLVGSHASRWRKEVREDGAADRLTQDAIARLRGLRLIRCTDAGVVPLAACGRYAVGQSPNADDEE